MKIAICTSEAVPFAKTGGLADVCGALPLELEGLGAETVLIMPKYQSVRFSGAMFRPLGTDYEWSPMGESVKAYFVKHETYLRSGLYGDRFGDFPDNLKRFSYFCHKSLELLRHIGFDADIVHCHDWQTSLIPVILADRRSRGNMGKIPRTLLTIHNMAYQGVFPKDQMVETGLGWDYFSVSGFEFYDKINLLKAGILYADSVNTVSATYSREVQTRDFGCGLEGVMTSRKDKFFGITNGVDYRVWNPQSDPFIFRNYGAGQMEGKEANRKALQEACGLASSDHVPLLGFVGRLVEQKGIDLIIKAMPRLCEQGYRTVILGSGEPRYESAFEELVKKYPGLLYFSSNFDDRLAHQIYAGSDIFLMPSQFEPCGIGQLISFKYGTVPVVFKTGGLADTVSDYDRVKRGGTGFVFHRHTKDELLVAIQRAGELFADQKAWRELTTHVMRLNFSWRESARRYMDLYVKVLSVGL